MTCRELTELVTDYLEDALAPGERVRFEEHLETCDGCLKRFQFEAGVLDELRGKLRRVSAQAALAERLRAAMRRS